MSQTPQMDVLYMQATWHVLGIFTRNAEPTPPTDPTPFVGAGLSLAAIASNQTLPLVVPPSFIGIFSTDRNWRQIFEPNTLYASGLPGTPSLAPITNPLTAVSEVHASPNITVTFPTGTTGTILVLVVDSAGGAAVAFPVPLTASNVTVVGNQTSIAVPMTGLKTGDTYYPFVFVPQCPVPAPVSFIA